jgi:uncharacterized SAM-binding protein YcdF (DUF218 family)
MMAMFDLLMQYVRTIVTAAATPPMGFLWLVLIGLTVARARKWPRRLCVGLGLAGLYASGTPVVSHALISGLESAPPAPQETLDPAAIVILGGDGRLVESPPDGAEPGPLSLQRLSAGAALARRTGLPVLITGGSVGHGQPPVSDLMAESFIGEFRLPVAWREEASENTCENAAFSARILRRAGIGGAWVVTHAWHMKRTLLSFAQAGYPVRPAPLAAERYEVSGVLDFLPLMSGWNRSYYAFHEWIGLAAYRLGACGRSAA